MRKWKVFDGSERGFLFEKQIVFKLSPSSKKNENHQFWHPFWHHFGSLLASFFDTFSASIFGCFFGCHFFDFWSKMVAKWLLKTPAHGSIFAPKAALGAHFRDLFRSLIFWCILVALWLHFGSILAPFCSLLAPFWLPLAPYWLPFGHFCSTFTHFWLHFCSLLMFFTIFLKFVRFSFTATDSARHPQTIRRDSWLARSNFLRPGAGTLP